MMICELCGTWMRSVVFRCPVCGTIVCVRCALTADNGELVCSDYCVSELREESAARAHRDVALEARASGKIKKPRFSLPGSNRF